MFLPDQAEGAKPQRRLLPVFRAMDLLPVLLSVTGCVSPLINTHAHTFHNTLIQGLHHSNCPLTLRTDIFHHLVSFLSSPISPPLLPELSTPHKAASHSLHLLLQPCPPSILPSSGTLHGLSSVAPQSPPSITKTVSLFCSKISYSQLPAPDLERGEAVKQTHLSYTILSCKPSERLCVTLLLFISSLVPWPNCSVLDGVFWPFHCTS